MTASYAPFEEAEQRDVCVFLFKHVKEFSFMDSNQTVRLRFRCMYYMFSSRS